MERENEIKPIPILGKTGPRERALDWLNYHHLHYFWLAAREGSITRASEQLRLAQQTVGSQIRQLEDALGEPLLLRDGRRIALTETGRVVYRYAEEIFGLGRELTETVRGRAGVGPLQLTVGVTDVVPKTVVYRLLEPALDGARPLRLVLHEDRSFETFLHDLAHHAVDLVIADVPASGDAASRVFNHLLGECGTSVLASESVAARVGAGGLPGSLDGLPFLLPGRRSGAHRALRGWLDAHRVHPTIVAEADDTALVQLLAEKGLGAIAIPTVVEAETLRRYDLRVIGRVAEVKHTFYAISAERRLEHPAVVAICETASRALFGEPP